MSNTIIHRAFASINIAIRAERRATGARVRRAASINLDAAATLATGLLGPGMGDAWEHLVDAWHGV